MIGTVHEKLIVTWLIKNFPAFIELECSSFSQKPAAGPYLMPYLNSGYIAILSL
jgi:hypothetical protein